MSRPLLVMTIVGLLSTQARADDREQASSHARRAVALYEVGRFDAALVEFEQAYILYPTDTLLFNLAQTHRKLEHCREAMELYRRLLDRNPESPRAPAVKRLLPALEQACKVKDEAPRGVQPAESDTNPGQTISSAASAPARTIAPAIAPATSSDIDDAEDPDDAATEIARNAQTHVYAGLTAGSFSSAASGVAPMGAAAGATWRGRRLPVDPGLRVAATGYTWAGSGYRGSSSAIGLFATAGRGIRRSAFDLRADVGLGVTVLTGLETGHPLLARGRRVPSGATTVPTLEIVAGGERQFGERWQAVGAVRAGVAHGGDTFGGALLSLAVVLGVGYSL